MLHLLIFFLIRKESVLDAQICFLLSRSIDLKRLLYGNFGEKFPPNGTGIFLASKTGTGLSCTIYKIPVSFSLCLNIKPGTSESKQMVQKISVFSLKTGKRWYLEKYSFFLQNFHRPDELFHLNSPRNFQVFHTSGKRSLISFSLPSPFSITRFNFFFMSIINQSFAFSPG